MSHRLIGKKIFLPILSRFHCSYWRSWGQKSAPKPPQRFKNNRKSDTHDSRGWPPTFFRYQRCQQRQSEYSRAHGVRYRGVELAWERIRWNRWNAWNTSCEKAGLISSTLIYPGGRRRWSRRRDWSLRNANAVDSERSPWELRVGMVLHSV